MNSYELLNKVKTIYQYDSLINSKEIDEINDITNKNTGTVNILDDIIEHPFVSDNTTLTAYHNDICEDTHLILYRYNTSNANIFVEFYLLNGDFLSVQQTIVDICSVAVDGKKQIKGCIKYNGINHILVQVRNNTDYINWVTLWDILTNRHICRVNVHINVVTFFNEYSEIANLIRHNKILPKPIVLYGYVDTVYKNYIATNKSILYCQDNTMGTITLHRDADEYDNTRNICFAEDVELNGDIHTLNTSVNSHIVVKNNNNREDWIFKSDNLIISYFYKSE